MGGGEGVKALEGWEGARLENGGGGVGCCYLAEIIEVWNQRDAGQNRTESWRGSGGRGEEGGLEGQLRKPPRPRLTLRVH